MALTLTQCGEKEGKALHLKGKVAGTGDSLRIAVLTLANNQVEASDTVVGLNNGTFDLTMPVDKAKVLQINDVAAEKEGLFAGIRLVAMPGEELTVNGNLNNDYTIDGSDFYKKYNEANKVLLPFDKELNRLLGEADRKRNGGTLTEEDMRTLERKATEVAVKKEKAVMDFVKAHPSYEASAALVTMVGQDNVDRLVSMLTPNVRNGRMKDFLEPFVKTLKGQQPAGEEGGQEDGGPAYNFTLNDINGKPFQLSSLRGKYVVLDFWGSWCGWCIKGMPQMKEYYRKYKGKMEIVGIDCNEPEQAWKEAVKKHELPWIHVYNAEESDITGRYQVRGFPTKVVVDPKGNIAKVVVGEDPSFYEYLDRLFGK